MPSKSCLTNLLPLEKCQAQPYFSNRIQIADIIEWVLGQTGPADILISTFSTAEEFIRRLHRLQNSGLVRSCELFCDLRGARKTASLYHFIKSVFSKVHLCQNHSKVALIFNDRLRVAVVTSQNQTRGDRFEAGVITCIDHVFSNLMLGFDALAANSISIDDVLARYVDSDL